MTVQLNSVKFSHRRPLTQVLQRLAARPKYWGLFTRVAEQLKVTPQHVRMVAAGLRGSKRVVSALREEIRRIERNSRRAA